VLQVASISQLTVSRLSRQCGILNISQPYRPPRPATGIALLLFHVTHAFKTYWDWRCSSNLLNLGTREKFCQLYVSASYSPMLEAAVPIGYGAGWVPEPACGVEKRLLPISCTELRALACRPSLYRMIP
jgi:hypothetical protein